MVVNRGVLFVKILQAVIIVKKNFFKMEVIVNNVTIQDALLAKIMLLIVSFLANLVAKLVILKENVIVVNLTNIWKMEIAMIAILVV